MKKVIIAIFLFLSKFCFSQDIFTYYGETKHYFEETGALYAKYKNNVSNSQKEQIISLLKRNNISVDSFEGNKIIRLYHTDNSALAKETITTLIDYNSAFDFISQELIYTGDNTIQFVGNSFFLSIKPTVSIDRLLDSLNVPYISYNRINPYNDREYYISYISNSHDAFYYSNLIYESGMVYYAQPCFYRLTSLDNGHYINQWGLNNTGQYGGIYGIDINAEQAWLISSGAGIKVAVIDNGVQLTHPDLSNNLIQGYDATGGNSNGSSTYNDYHGTCCAGIIAAEDNNRGVKGVAYDAKIIPIKLFNGSGYDLYLYNDSNIIWAFNYALAKGADIISCSWGGGSGTRALDTAIYNAVTHGRNNKGCVVVFSSGNDNWSFINYPSNQNGVISVGAISQCGERKSPSSCDEETDWLGSNYGEGLSVVAPGVKIATTTLTRRGTYTTTFNGTSSAGPHVAGVAALMLSVNPHLTRQEVKDIIEQTAQKVRPDLYNYIDTIGYNNGTWNKYTGYGLVDALAAVSRAKNLNYDLYTRDNTNDDGSEPINYSNTDISDSPDIWIRNLNDGIVNHQAITYGTNYLYAHIYNKGPDTSFNNTDSIRFLYKPAFLTLHNNPTHWQQLAVSKIPRIAGGHDTVICIPFSTSNINSGMNYTIYSRIESPFDPLHTNETASYDTNILQNNNISCKNVLFSNIEHCENNYCLYATFSSNAPSDILETSNIHINFLDIDLSNVEISLVFPEDLWAFWMPTSTNLKQLDNNTFLVTGESVDLYGVPETTITLRYNFLTHGNQSTIFFKNHIIQYVDNGDREEIIGALTVQVEKPERSEDNLFAANAGNDTTVLYGTDVILHATQIDENATYRWFDLDRKLKHEGANYSITPFQSAEYILEVTAKSDGYRDLDTVKVNVVPGQIRSITPNPVTDNYVTLSYEYAPNITSAQLLIYNTVTTELVGYYDLSNIGNVSSLDIDVSNYSIGTYTTVLICDNVVCHSKILIKQ